MADADVVSQAIEENSQVIAALRDPAIVDAITSAADVIGGSLGAGGNVLLFGNGGSAADASHVATELLGRFLRERPAASAVALSDNALGRHGDRQRLRLRRRVRATGRGLGRAGDAAVAISTSGRSPNVLAGVRAARERGLATVGITGAGGGLLAGEVDVLIAVPSTSTPRIQEAHSLILHALCDLVERRMA